MSEDSIDNLETLKKSDIKAAFLKQRKDIGWNFYSERQFIENLFGNRFNYFIIMYSLFIMASASVDNKKSLLIILGLGIIMLSLVWVTLYRAFVKLIINLRILHNLNIEGHVFEIINNEVKRRNKTWWKWSFSVIYLIGIIIPFFCIFSLILGWISVYNDWFIPFKK